MENKQESIRSDAEIISSLEELILLLAQQYKERGASPEEITALTELAKVTFQITGRL